MIRLLECDKGRWHWVAVFTTQPRKLKSLFKGFGIAVDDNCIAQVNCVGELELTVAQEVPITILDEGVLRLKPPVAPSEPRKEDQLGEQLKVAHAILNVLVIPIITSTSKLGFRINLGKEHLRRALDKIKPGITSQEAEEYGQDAFGILRDNWNLSLAENTARGRFATLVANLKADLKVATFQQATQRITMWDKSPDPIDLSPFTGKPARAQRGS